MPDFTAPLPVIVNGYVSPCVSYTGYANQFSEVQPTGWYPLTALAPSGVVHKVGKGLMAGVADMDTQVQLLQEQLRLQSCRMVEIDNWSADYVGVMFQRYPNESPEFYIPRLELMIGKPRCTILAVKAFAQAWINSYTYGRGTPTILVWDKMTQPVLSTLFGVQAGQLVIQIGNITFLPPAQTVTSIAPDARLGLLIDYLAKACGVQALYYVQDGAPLSA